MKAVFNSGKNNRFPSKLTIGKSYVISEARPDGVFIHTILFYVMKRNILGNKFISIEVQRNKMLI
jgi:hypothetical protein